jgi:hypothetical protein
MRVAAMMAVNFGGNFILDGKVLPGGFLIVQQSCGCPRHLSPDHRSRHKE